ncbi:MAG: DUF1837 domain-containing protein [Chitinophagaceae bacterium]|nr:DUF1837 domain-containing protein [Chitinophagaceae bacterium]
MATDIDIKPLLNKIDSLIATTFFVKAEVGLTPKSEHIITSIKYQGLNQMRTQFVRRLVNSIVKYVFSKSKLEALTKELTQLEKLDDGDIHAEIFQQARQFFRSSDVRGQFSELLLFNFLQYYFEALPVVRKMVITTNPEVERHGADAIHLGKSVPGGFQVYLGEAKTYTSGFKGAFENAIKSIVSAYREHRSELQLYKYEEFLEPEVRSLMKDYLNIKIELPVKLVVIISYCTGATPDKASSEEYQQHYIEHVLNECLKIKDSHYKDSDNKPVNHALLKEINYILFPVNDLEKLLEEFKTSIGLP